MIKTPNVTCPSLQKLCTKVGTEARSKLRTPHLELKQLHLAHRSKPQKWATSRTRGEIGRQSQRAKTFCPKSRLRTLPLWPLLRKLPRSQQLVHDPNN